MTAPAPAARRSEPWTVGRLLAWAAGDLRGRGMSTPRLDAELLLGQVLGVDRVALLVGAARELTREELAGYRELHKRRRAGEPVAYLRGVREFYGRDFRVDRRVLVPRPDTETLVDVALERTRRVSMSLRGLDLCTGSGCVAITLALERPNARVLGADLSLEALEVALWNAARLGAMPRAGFLASDLYGALDAARHRFDLITANPPYIPLGEAASLPPDVVAFEPHLALFGGVDGLAFTRRVIAGARAFLAADGVLAVEVGAGQAIEVARLFREDGFVEVQVRRDLAGIERVVSGLSPSPGRPPAG